MNNQPESLPQDKKEDHGDLKKPSSKTQILNAEFLIMLAHELRNPLAPLSNALEIWRSDNAGEKAENEAQIIMDRQLQQISQLVDDLIDVANITRNVIIIEEEPVDLVSVINFSIEKLRPQFGARQQEISLSLPKEGVFVKGDLVRLKQVVYNLLVNATKYTGSGGRISVTLECEAGNALIRIADNGVGISPELLPHIFELSVQKERSSDKKRGGLGLGLTLARHLVELQGGTIEAKSSGLEKGSEFIVSMPVTSGIGSVFP